LTAAFPGTQGDFSIVLLHLFSNSDFERHRNEAEIMKRMPFVLALLVGFVMLAGADGCSSDPNVEGAKLDLRNKDYDRALENLETAIANNPDNAEAYKLKGDVLQEKAAIVTDIAEHSTMVDQMITAYGRATELGLDVSREMALAFYKEFDLGGKAFNRGRDNKEAYTDAAGFFRNATKIYPDSAGPYVNMAYSLINAGNLTEAVAPFEKAVQMGDKDAQTYVFLADLYNQSDRSNDAVTLLEEASEMFPDNTDIQAQLLNAFQSSGQIDRAMEKYEEQIASDPDNKLYRYNFGSLLLQAEDFGKAIENLTRAVELDPEYGNAFYNLGAAYVNQAVEYSEEINTIDDELRSNRDTMSAADISAREARMEELAEMRRASFAEAIGPLERAKELTEIKGEDLTGICMALFSAYVQTDQEDMAKSVQSCAGYEDM
jgi:tetratricopeptide (TPR) repeat protein